jgi:hypothetical protein
MPGTELSSVHEGVSVLGSRYFCSYFTNEAWKRQVTCLTSIRSWFRSSWVLLTCHACSLLCESPTPGGTAASSERATGRVLSSAWPLFNAPSSAPHLLLLPQRGAGHPWTEPQASAPSSPGTGAVRPLLDAVQKAGQRRERWGQCVLVSTGQGSSSGPQDLSMTCSHLESGPGLGTSVGPPSFVSQLLQAAFQPSGLQVPLCS